MPSGELEAALSEFEIHCVQDGRSQELAMFHRRTATLVNSDLIYSSSPACCAGPGGPQHRYTEPGWFARFQQHLYYDLSPVPLLPAYRLELEGAHASGMASSIERILQWPFAVEGGFCMSCHLDPISGMDAARLLKESWGWLHGDVDEIDAVRTQARGMHKAVRL